MGNAVREYSLEQKVHLSDSVVIGRVVSVKKEPEGGAPSEYAHVQVDKVLKGPSLETIDVMTKGSISEMDLECCEVGKVYIFFLMKTKKNNTFMSVNGRYGVSLIPIR